MDRFAFAIGGGMSFVGALRQAANGNDAQACALFVICFVCVSTISILGALRK